MNQLIPYIMAILAGIFTTFEGVLNSQLGKELNPRLATLHSLITGALVFLIANLLSGSISQYRLILTVKPSLLLGGIFGALIIYLITLTIPHLGVTVTFTIVIAAQILCSFYVDTFILHQQPFDIKKVAGAILITAGIYFILE